MRTSLRRRPDLAASPLPGAALTTPLTLVGVLVLGACNVFQETRVGSGVSATDERPLADFERVELAGEVVVDLRVGGEPRVRVTFDDNLLPYVITEVEDGALEVRLEGNARYRTDAPLRVEIVAPRLSGVSAAGGVELTAEGVDSERLELSVAGSGDLRVRGRATELSASIAGSGELDLRELVTERAEVSIAGSGDVELHASQQLDVSIAGSGDVAYLGEPTVTQSVLGSGDVRRLPPR